jgi:outer membrane protein assembly factor BamB
MTPEHVTYEEGILPMRTATRLTLVPLIAAIFCAPSSAQEWTRFRGPNGTGVSHAESIPVRFTEADYRWRTQLPGKGHASPVVWGDKVFLLSGEPASAVRYVLCLDARDGHILWQRTYDSTFHQLHPRNTFASSTPAVDEHRVYVAWSTPDQVTIRALDHAGHEVWMRDLGTWTSQHGFGTSPILYQDLVIVFNSQQVEQLDPGQKPGASQMIALDRETGEVRWSQPRTSTRVCYSTPCIYQPQQGPAELICCSTGDGIFSLDPRTGKPNWSLTVFEMRTVASPIVVGDLVLASNGAGGFSDNYLVAVRAGTSPAEVYRVRKAAYVATPVAYGDLVFTFFDAGFVKCFEAASGQEVWNKRVSPGFSGSPVLVRDKLYCIDDRGDVFVLAASREFQELARNPLGEPSRATPAVSGGRMFLRTESQLFCLGGHET